MSYRAFYREWRPQCFSEVVGQEHIVRTLQNALKAGQIGHAYLFSGPRGTGKTSIAKIFAKSVNCMNGPDIEPCNQCPHCTGITNGSFVDVLEIDAASNRGIDEIRDLKEKVRYLPAEGKYKVYIIDEVHMLTTEAFNALLKTLEEPPAHVIFLLATTEPHKLPATILSRCQRFDFRRLSIKEIADRLREVADFHKIKTNDGALVLIARYAEGAMRDALGLLEQAASFGDNVITEKDVISILGIIDDEITFQVGEAMVKENHGALIQIVSNVISSGKDPKELMHAIIVHFRNLLVVRSIDEPGDLITMPDEGIERLKKQAECLDEDEILHILDFLTRTEGDLRWSILPRITVETALLRLTGLGPANKNTLIAERMTHMEREIARLKEKRHRVLLLDADQSADCRNEETQSSKEYQYDTREDIEHAHVDEDPLAMLLDDTGEDVLTFTAIKALWPQVLARSKKKSRTLHSFLTEGQPLSYENGQIILGFRFVIHKEQIEKRENRLIVEEILQEQFKEKITVICQVDDNEKTENKAKKENFTDSEEKQMDRHHDTSEDLDLFGGKIVDLSN